MFPETVRFSFGSLRIPLRAAVLHGGNTYHSAYEVYVVNFGSTPMKITHIGITGRKEGRALFTERLTGESITHAFQLAGTKPTPSTKPILKPGQSGALFLFPTLDENRLPSELEMAVTIEGRGRYGGSGTVEVASIALDNAPPITIAPPIYGTNWLAINGPSNKSVHRRAILFYGGKPKIGQRYAIDWVKVGADGRTFHGDEHNNKSYYAYDAEIHAVADGTIIEVKDGIPENLPNSGKIAAPISSDTLAGNHIIENLGSGRFAAYAHLRPGSLKVKAGDKVRAGQVLAHLGNTGNSSEPHLHFQICDAPSFPDSEGLPFAISQFSRIEYKIERQSGGAPQMAIGRAQAMIDQEPIEDELDSFEIK
jgi:biotin carboxyl carrier protein